MLEALNTLLIDDNPDDAFLMEAALDEAPDLAFRLTWVQRLGAGLEKLRDGGWAVVLLDLTLPDAHGIDTFARVQATCPDVPIVVLTGMDDQALANTALQEGAQDYLVKGQVDGALLARSIHYAVQRKQAEKALRESEERYRTLFEQSRDAIFITHDGTVVEVNAAALELFGYEERDVMGIDVGRIFVDPTERVGLRQELDRYGSVKDFEARFRCKDGSVIDCLLTATEQTTRDTGVRRVQGVIRDVTQRKLSEAQLKASLEEKERLIAEVRQLYDQERRRVELMRRVNEIALGVSSVLSLDHLLKYVPRVLRDAFDYYNVNIFLVEQETGDFVLMAGSVRHQGPDRPVHIGERISPGQRSIIAWVGQHGEVIMANDVTREPRYRPLPHLPKTKSELAVPIKLGDSILGVLDIESSNVNSFDETDQFTALTLANQLAVGIENARLFEQTTDLAILEERNRMAREIHDTLAQGFTGIILQLEAAEQALDESPSEVRGHLTRAKALGRESLQEARRSVWDLLPKALEERHLDLALKDEVDRFATTERAEATFSVTGVRREIVPIAQAALLRICQEALNNVRKHAVATRVLVGLTYTVDTVTLTIEDNGGGFDTAAARAISVQGGFGLIGMRQRARLIHGELLIQSEPGKGTLVEVKVPTS